MLSAIKCKWAWSMEIRWVISRGSWCWRGRGRGWLVRFRIGKSMYNNDLRCPPEPGLPGGPSMEIGLPHIGVRSPVTPSRGGMTEIYTYCQLMLKGCRKFTILLSTIVHGYEPTIINWGLQADNLWVTHRMKVFGPWGSFSCAHKYRLIPNVQGVYEYWQMSVS